MLRTLPRRFVLAASGVALALIVTACDQSTPAEVTAVVTTQPTQQTWLLPTPTLATDLPGITPGPTATDRPPPTATPLPADYVEQGQDLLEQGDYDAAARALQSALSKPGSLDRSQQADALYALARAYLGDARHTEAIDALQQFLRLKASENGGNFGEDAPGVAAPASDDDALMAHFQMAEAYRALGDCQSALEAYETYLAGDALLEAYVYPRVATCHQELGDVTAAIAAFEAAVNAPAHRLVEVENRLKLAELTLAAGNTSEAIVQYDAVRDLAQTENTKGEMTYLAGLAELEAGNQQAGYDRFLQGVNDFPGSYHSYLALVELVDAGVPVDDYQRGLVDYYAQAYEAGIAAFDAYILANPDAYRPEARLYLAWSYEALGNPEAALAQLDAYSQIERDADSDTFMARAMVERGKMLARAGQAQPAIDAYQELLTNYPETEHAPYAAWWSAALAAQLGEAETARNHYLAFAERFPQHDDAPQALFEAAMLAWQDGQSDEAEGTWQRLADNYGQTDLGAAALIWLMRTSAQEEEESYVITATQLSSTSYYALRARHMASGIAPFEPPPELQLGADEAQEREEAETWLQEWAGLADVTVTSELSPTLAADVRLQRGEKLWRLDLFAEAKQELEALRQELAGDPLASYQLALYFRDLGLYRSSILAADTVLRLSGQTVFNAPRLIGRLSYPVYYQDLILELAQEYEYDPLLQFSLVRQESLYESFIASHVGAQGLSQVMPATGEDIARRLGWPDYSSEDLYRPSVGLAFGAYYLHQQLESFDGDIYAALSAYNAGPGNAARWFALAPHDPDLYFEVVDFAETRSYIQRIYVGYVIYRHLYGEL